MNKGVFYSSAKHDYIVSFLRGLFLTDEFGITIISLFPGNHGRHKCIRGRSHIGTLMLIPFSLAPSAFLYTVQKMGQNIERDASQVFYL